MAICLALGGGLGGAPIDGPQERVGTPPGLEQSTPAPEHWAVRGGTTTILFDLDVMNQWDLSPGIPEGILPEVSARQLVIRRESSLTFSVVGGSVERVLGGGILHLGDLRLSRSQRDYVLSDLIIVPSGADTPDAVWAAESVTGAGGLLLRRTKLGFDPSSRTLTLRAAELRMSPDLAAAMGEPKLADVVLGSVTVHAAAQWFGGARPDGGGEGQTVLQPPDPESAEGGDMTFCQLFGLYMPFGSRLGHTVGLGVGTTSWNIGTADMMWFPVPNEEHPFIVMNLYRLKDDRFEQIGQSHIKHGFYALASHQCGGAPCTYEPGHSSGNWLGTGCTDTYGASLNAYQGGMGPKYEVNPWTGAWYYPGSHMYANHSHDWIQHRIQVNDDDLDPAFNQGATYYVEGYYAMLDDVNVMNSAAWKPVTVSGSTGENYYFSMSGSGTYPNIGFAIDAWPGAAQTVIAQEIPVVEFVSPDGRCVLAAKATQLDADTWHYEYAMLNIDMDRQVGSFRVPLPPGTTATNVEFHSVRHHDEPFNTADPDAVPIDNAPWAVTVGAGACIWSTTTNPLRWGSMYNFRFDANVPPTTTTAELGLFRPGTPGTLTGLTLGPSPICTADLDDDGIVGVLDLLDLLVLWGTDPGGPPDLNGDGTVNVIDLLWMLAIWGPCP